VLRIVTGQTGNQMDGSASKQRRCWLTVVLGCAAALCVYVASAFSVDAVVCAERTTSQHGHELGHGSPSEPTPKFRLLRPKQLASGHSGVLHYDGPPVPFGGLVVFDNLPRARLKFTFDRTAWRLILKANPDGTRKAVLSSLKQGLQTICDLGWETVE
jgi:hypothetical protein